MMESQEGRSLYHHWRENLPIMNAHSNFGLCISKKETFAGRLFPKQGVTIIPPTWHLPCVDAHQLQETMQGDSLYILPLPQW